MKNTATRPLSLQFDRYTARCFSWNYHFLSIGNRCVKSFLALVNLQCTQNNNEGLILPNQKFLSPIETKLDDVTMQVKFINDFFKCLVTPLLWLAFAMIDIDCARLTISPPQNPHLQSHILLLLVVSAYTSAVYASESISLAYLLFL